MVTILFCYLFLSIRAFYASLVWDLMKFSPKLSTLLCKASWLVRRGKCVFTSSVMVGLTMAVLID